MYVFASVVALPMEKRIVHFAYRRQGLPDVSLAWSVVPRLHYSRGPTLEETMKSDDANLPVKDDGDAESHFCR